VRIEEMQDIFRVMVRCPATTKVLDTGIRTSGREALKSGFFEQGKIFCSYCGMSHNFKENAFFSLEQDSTGQDGLWRPNP